MTGLQKFKRILNHPLLAPVVEPVKSGVQQARIAAEYFSRPWRKGFTTAQRNGQGFGACMIAGWHENVNFINGQMTRKDAHIMGIILGCVMGMGAVIGGVEGFGLKETLNPYSLIALMGAATGFCTLTFPLAFTALATTVVGAISTLRPKAVGRGFKKAFDFARHPQNYQPAEITLKQVDWSAERYDMDVILSSVTKLPSEERRGLFERLEGKLEADFKDLPRKKAEKEEKRRLESMGPKGGGGAK